ncbi:MAG: protein kinase [Lachnospiraceae bacterium]|nr:protein kinase [Lachnospiraceae bacterium]
MYPILKEGEELHFISDKEPGRSGFEVDLKMKREIYQNGRKQGLLAHDKYTGKAYFVKVLFCGDLDEVYVEKESKVQMYSPFIIRIYGGMLDREKDRFITLIEYRKEPDLSDLIRFGALNGYSSEEKLAIKHKIVLKILYGIHHYMSMYENDPIVHRDIKPENIMASKDGEIVKIIDFDWVHLHKSNVTILTRREQKGTLGYAEPKSWNSYAAKKQMDIYSAGLVFYFIYMEKHHFSGQDDISRYLLADDFAYTLKDTGGMDLELRAILQKMIAREEDRYEKIEDVIYDFVRYLRRTGQYPIIPELMMEEPSDRVRLYYRVGPITYSPVLKNYRFLSVEYGRKQLRSKNGEFSSHILSFFRAGEEIKAVILDPRCKKTLSQSEELEIVREGDCFEYADTKIEILKIKEMEEWKIE